MNTQGPEKPISSAMDAAVAFSDLITGMPANQVHDATDTDLAEFGPSERNVVNATLTNDGAYFYAPAGGKMFMVAVVPVDMTVDNFDMHLNMIQAAMQRGRPAV